MPSTNPVERRLAASVAAHTKWSRTPDRAAATAPAREAFQARFIREVDPDGALDPATRDRLVASARKAYFQRLALASAKARRAGGEHA